MTGRGSPYVDTSISFPTMGSAHSDEGRPDARLAKLLMDSRPGLRALLPVAAALSTREAPSKLPPSGHGSGTPRAQSPVSVPTLQMWISCGLEAIRASGGRLP
jgi:hypothetical protein